MCSAPCTNASAELHVWIYFVIIEKKHGFNSTSVWLYFECPLNFLAFKGSLHTLPEKDIRVSRLVKTQSGLLIKLTEAITGSSAITR